MKVADGPKGYDAKQCWLRSAEHAIFSGGNLKLLSAFACFVILAGANAQSPVSPAFLPATPATVAWGYYWSKAKPASSVHAIADFKP